MLATDTAAAVLAVVCLLLWLTERTPPFVPTLALLAALPWCGVGVGEGLRSMADPVLALFFGGFVLGEACAAHGLDRLLRGALRVPPAPYGVRWLLALLLSGLIGVARIVPSSPALLRSFQGIQIQCLTVTLIDTQGVVCRQRATSRPWYVVPSDLSVGVMPVLWFAIAHAGTYSNDHCLDPTISGSPFPLGAFCASGTLGTASTETVDTFACSQDGVTYYVVERINTYWGDELQWYYSADTLELVATYVCPDYTYYGCSCWWSGLLLDECSDRSSIECPEPTTAPSADTGDVGRWELTGSMTAPNRDHRAVLLDDGRVLLVGGLVGTAETYDAPSGTFSATAPPLAHHGQGLTATLLRDGRVLVVGGFVSPGAAELYDPATGAWSRTAGVPTDARVFHTATLLQDGRVLLAGGRDATGAAQRSAEVFDLETESFSPTGGLQADRVNAGDALIADGSVLVVGGSSGAAGYSVASSSAERYDPVEGRFTMTGAMSVARSGPAVTLLADGRVLVVSQGTGEVFDGGSFRSVGDLAVARRGIVGLAHLPDGGVLLSGGYTDTGPVVTETVERFDPASGTFTLISPMNVGRNEHTATLLGDGSVLVTGGHDGTAETSTSERYWVPEATRGARSGHADRRRCGCEGTYGSGIATLVAAAVVWRRRPHRRRR